MEKAIIHSLVILLSYLSMACSKNTPNSPDEKQSMAYKKFKNEIIAIGGEDDLKKMTIKTPDSINYITISYNEFIELYKFYKNNESLLQKDSVLSRALTRGAFDYEISGTSRLIIDVRDVYVPKTLDSIFKSKRFRFILTWEPKGWSNNSASYSECYRTTNNNTEQPFSIGRFSANYDKYIDDIYLASEFVMNFGVRLIGVKTPETDGNVQVLYLYVLGTNAKIKHSGHFTNYDYEFNIRLE